MIPLFKAFFYEHANECPLPVKILNVTLQEKWAELARLASLQNALDANLLALRTANPANAVRIQQKHSQLEKTDQSFALHHKLSIGWKARQEKHATTT